MHPVHLCACVVLLVATVSAAPRKGITINITGPVHIIVGRLGTNEEGCGSQIDVAGPEHTNVPTADQCTVENGFCVVTGDRCNGTINKLYNTYQDHCVCCIPEKQGCAEGFLMSKDSKQCFKLFNDEKLRWEEGKYKCNYVGLVMAHPSDAVAAALQKDLIDTYGGAHIWMGARGDGSKFVWQREGTALRSDNALWYPGFPGSSISTKYCLLLTMYESDWRANPGRPYHDIACSHTFYVLCEEIRE